MKPSSRHAFTLIELLVVISIIALLIGILLPALGAARYSARNIQCASQEQQLGRAFAAYQADEDGYYPLGAAQVPGYGPVEFTWDDRLAIGSYDGRSGSSLGDAKTDYGNPVNVNTDGAEAQLYSCPIALGLGLEHRTSYDAAGSNIRAPRTYAMTQWDIETNGQTAAARRGITGFDYSKGSIFTLNAAISRRSEGISNASDTIALGDNLGVVVNAPEPYVQNTLGGWESALFWGSVHDPRFTNPVTSTAGLIGHHSSSRQNPSGTRRTDFEPNYLFGDGHVSTQNSLLAYEGRDPGGLAGSTFNVVGTQFDAER